MNMWKTNTHCLSSDNQFELSSSSPKCLYRKKPNGANRIMWTCDAKASKIAFFVILALLLPETGIVSAQKENGTFDIKVTSSDPQQGPDDSDVLTKLKLNRGALVNDFWDLKQLLEEMIDNYGGHFTGKEDDIYTLIRDLKNKWGEIQDLSIQILRHTSSIAESGGKEHEKNFQKELANDYAAVLYRAKARACESAEETLYELKNKCFPFGENYDASSGLCPPDQLLFDIEGKNKGICDCRIETGLVFHNETKLCYLLNTQGPCNPGKWLLLVEEKKNFPVCKSIPDLNCPTDGKHVFYEGNCWKLGTKGPCRENEILDREPKKWIDVVCVTDSSNAGFSPSIFDKASGSCRPGQSQTQNKECRDVQ